MKNLVDAQWLKEHLYDENLVILDCRFSLMDEEYGERSYYKDHIKGAIRLDIEKDLSAPVQLHGGRHPLPSPEKLKDTFENVGINNDSIVVAYDEGDLAGPSRLWWILKYLGHDKVYILNGGIRQFEEIGGEITKDIDEIKKGKFKVNLREYMRVDRTYVKERLLNDKVAIVDSRDARRYRGEVEPIDKIAGHIPGALNYFWMNILHIDAEHMSLKSEDFIKSYFSKLKDYDEVIVYCGSGITACSNSLALTEVGIKHKVYAGSYSDWISYDDNKVETN